MVSSNLETKHKKLYYKALYLKAELEEVDVIFNECSQNFLIEVAKLEGASPRMSLGDAAKNLSKGLGEIFSKDEDDPSLGIFKKLYRKIMLKAHPDKLVSVEDEGTKKLYSDICRKAMSAMENGDWYLLFGAATDLGIVDIEVDDRHIERIEEDCKCIEAKISGRKISLPWVWAHSDEDMKGKYLDQYLKNKA